MFPTVEFTDPGCPVFVAAKQRNSNPLNIPQNLNEELA